MGCIEGGVGVGEYVCAGGNAGEINGGARIVRLKGLVIRKEVLCRQNILCLLRCLLKVTKAIRRPYMFEGETNGNFIRKNELKTAVCRIKGDLLYKSTQLNSKSLHVESL